jgi:prepilin-type N-terminal cleavage/methylation domain-containing protein
MRESFIKGGSRMKRGFTLLELIVVIIIIGILATLGFTQYTQVIEKGRSAEAKALLGNIRTAEIGYNTENGTYGAIANLPVGAPTACTTTNYFSYAAAAGVTTGTATRCTSGGKVPTGPTYSILVDYTTGVWSGTAGYF